MSYFYDIDKVCFSDGKVLKGASDHAPFEAVFRFLLCVDPTIKQDQKLHIIDDGAASVKTTVGENTDTVYIVIHKLSSDCKEAVNSDAKENGYQPIAGINKFLEAIHYDATVVNKENVTHIFFFQRISRQPGVYIKLAFSLRLLCPTLFQEGTPTFCDEFKKVMSFIDKDQLEKAQEIIEPYFIDLHRNQWLVDIKTMFVNSYGKQITEMKNSIDRYYGEIRSLNDSISAWYKKIEDQEIKIRGMLASNSTEENYDEFINYLSDIGAEIVDYRSGNMKIIFKGYIDDYDPQVAEDIIPSTDGDMYCDIDYNNRDDLSLVLRKTFLEGKYKLRVTSTHIIKQNDYRVDCEEYEHHPTSGVREKDGLTYLYNPHLWHYNCYGSNRNSDMYEYIKSYNYYALAIEINAANSNINFSDLVVMEKFAADIVKHRKHKMFFCPEDGKDYSMDDILAKEKGTVNGTEDSDTAAEE